MSKKMLILFIIFVFCFSVKAHAGIMEGLILYFPFNQDDGNVVIDQSGQGHDGNVFNASFTANGFSGGGFQFDGDGDYIRVLNAPALNTNQFTVSTWALTEELFVPQTGPNEARGIFGKHQAEQNSNSYWVSQRTTFQTDLPELHFQGWNNSSASESVLTDVTPLFNDWRLVTATYDGNSLNFYIDNILKGTVVNPDIFANNLDYLIGAGEYQYLTANPDRFWWGKLDEFRIYDRALSQADVNELYQSYKPGVVPEPATFILFGSGLFGVLARRQRKCRSI